jgi:UDP-galactopyranose mutase
MIATIANLPGPGDYDVVVVGAGLSGAVLAERYACCLGLRVLVLESRSHIGGNCYDFVNEHGIRVSRYGAHLFHTNDEQVWQYVNSFTEWVPWEHRVLACVNGEYVPIPVCIPTVCKLFGVDLETEGDMDRWLASVQVPSSNPADGRELCLSRVGHELYELLFRHYTYKQWQRYPEDLDPGVLARIPVRNNRDDRYFTDRYQALPRLGYSALFESMLDHPLITVLLDTDYFDVRGRLDGQHKLFYTGPIDRYYEYLGMEKLEYRSLIFETEHLNIANYQPNSVVNHPDRETPFIRVVEYKHFLNQQADCTTIVREYSTAEGEPYYPVPSARNHALYARYQRHAADEPGVYFVGRLASYKYFNMDKAIANALQLFQRLEGSRLSGYGDSGQVARTPA